MSHQILLDYVSRETLEKLRLYDSLLHKWQKAINLVSPNTLSESWERHFVDSLQLSQYVSRETSSLLDIGSGAGFPGLALAMQHPEVQVTLIESDARKCEFMKNVSRETKTPVQILNERIENAEHSVYDVVISRALAPLDKLFSYAHLFVDEKSSLLFLKGENYEAELHAAKVKWSFDYTVKPSLTDNRGVILEVKHLKRK